MVETNTSRVDLHDDARRAEVERALGQIPGVITARLVPGYERPVDELHALVDIDRAPKQIVRDLQSLLFTRYDLTIDHRVVSVVQLDGDGGPTLLGDAGSGRVALTSVTSTTSGMHTTIGVTLTDDEGVVHTGTATVATTVAARRGAAATATLAAVQHLLDDRVVTDLQGLHLVASADATIAVAAITVRGPRSEELVSGSAVVRTDETDAIGRAVLSALNRTIASARD